MEIRSGDWLCPQCHDLNFASRQMCRKCNTVRPDLASPYGAPSRMGAHHPYHAAMPSMGLQQYSQQHLGAVGGVGGTNPSLGGGGGDGSGMPGGEGSGGVNNEQALALQAMQQIQAFKAMQEQLQAAAMQHALVLQQQAALTQMMGRAGNVKPGDWFCPSCTELNFASRQSCRKCTAPRPPFSDPTIGTKPGDWFCPTCQDLNFAARTACRRCNTPHPAGMDPTLRMMYAQAQIPSNAKPGDWHCPSCAHLNFASRNSCRQCNSPRSASTTVLGVKPGDWFCAQCNDLNFASRTHCRKCSAAREGPPQQQPQQQQQP